LGFVSSDAAVVMNLFYLLTFPLTALSAFLCLRLLRVSGGVAVVCSLLYSLLPYHFYRGELNLFLSAYYCVPLAAYLVISVLAGTPLFVRRASSRTSRVLAYASGRSVLTIASCLVIGSTGIYYAAFALALLAAATVLAFVARRTGQPVVTGSVVMAVIALTVALNLAPTIWYEREHGDSKASLIRSPQDTERFSLVPVNLILPREDYRIGVLAERKRRYVSSTLLQSERGQSLGLVATVGLLWLLAVVLLSSLRPGWRLPDRVTRSSAVSVLVAILLGAVGGASTLVAYLVTPDLRAWNRISIFIAFFALVGVALLLERARRRLGATSRGRAAFAALLGAVLVVGALDQTSDRDVPAYGAVQHEYRQDAAFVRAIENALPRGASVFELPYVPFPEAGDIAPMADYDLVRGYLHSRHLRWSFGAMKGRPEDWSAALNGRDLALVVPAVTASGFDGIYVDRALYGDESRAAEKELRRVLHSAPLVSPSGRQLFFDLQGYAARLRAEYGNSELEALRTATLHPILVEDGGGLSALARVGGKTWRDGGANAQLRLVNPLSHPRRVELAARLERPSGNPADVTVSFPDGTSTSTTATSSGTPLRHALELAPGTNVIRFTVDTPPPAQPNQPPLPWFRLADVTVTDAAFAPVLSDRAP
jgi:phosphoglycerol transferase